MKKQKSNSGLPAAIIVSLLYILIFSASTGKELILLPERVVDLKKELPRPEGSDLIGFKLNGAFGYMTREGNLYYKGDIQYNIALSRGGFINYSSIQTADQSLVLFNPAGDFKSSFQIPGYPLLSEDGKRLFVVNIKGSGIKEIDESGKVLWGMNSTKIITSLAVGAETLAIGFSNGLLQLYNREGNVIYEHIARNSRLPIILGCTLNKEENRIAAVAGIEGQHLIFIEKKDGKYTEPLYHPLETDFRQEVFLCFSEDSEQLYIEHPGNIYNYQIKTKKGILFPITGKLVAFSQSGEFFSVISREKQFHFYLYSKDNTLMTKEVFSGEHVFNELDHRDLFLGINHYMIKTRLAEM